MEPSEMIHVTGGTLEVEMSLSLERRLRSGTRQFFEVESQRARMSWLTSASEGGRPSGMDSKRKSGKPSRELGPLELSKRPWL
jgi:hypothetical protein